MKPTIDETLTDLQQGLDRITSHVADSDATILTLRTNMAAIVNDLRRLRALVRDGKVVAADGLIDSMIILHGRQAP